MKPLEGILLFTVVEVLTMVGWLFFANRGSLVGVLILTGGLFVEHLVAYNVGRRASWFSWP